MELDRAREDLVVAITAAAVTVSVALVGRFVPAIDPGTFPMLAPVGVYFAYVFTRKGGPYGALDTARNWAVLAVLVGIAVLAWAAFL
ncbi:hypothetical protein JCM17823_02820 [Halorubrum gandharaense]